MATTHQTVSITNSCFKQPVHPKTGLPTSKTEREKDTLFNTWTIEGNPLEVTANNGLSKSVNFDTSASISDTLHQDLGSIPNEEIYQKLVALKKEHKKTLELCERLYTEKIEEKRGEHPATVSVSQEFTMLPKQTHARDKYNTMNGGFVEMHRTLTKPPSGRPKTADTTLQRSFSKERLNESAVSGRSTVSSMWENFSVDEYTAKNSTRPRSASLSRLTESRSKNSKNAENERKKQISEWKHKITVPKPFSMTLREATKVPKKYRVSAEIEKQRELKAREEEAECQKKFTARPVPAHIYMPLYDEITRKQEDIRRGNVERNKELLMSQEKPFKFMLREEEKKTQRKSSAKRNPLAAEDNKKKTQFKAKPFPDKLFQDTVADKMKEEEEYRRIKIEMRSHELLKTASLPPNMAARGQDYVDGRSRQKMYAERAKKAQMTTDHNFQPHVNEYMPDFDELHRKCLKEVAQRKAKREATVCKPFNLRTTGMDTKHKVYEDIERDEQTLRENRWPFQNPRARPKSAILSRTLSTSMDALPSKMTAAQQKRFEETKTKRDKQIQQELEELEQMRKRRIREQMLRQSIKEKTFVNDQSASLERQRKQKLKEYRETDQARQEEYQSLLAEMKERVDKKPLLFERTAQENARRAATKRYQATLAAAGVDEEFVQRKGASATASVVTGGALSEDDDDLGHSRKSSARSAGSRTSRHNDDTFDVVSGGDRTASEPEDA